jgi:tripeptidyl-peptidase-1
MMFSQLRAAKSTIVWDEDQADTVISPDAKPFVNPVSGVTVDPSCNTTITVSCLKQLYNAVGYVPSANIGNSIGITGYLEEFANIQDLQTFFADQVPAALNSTFKFISVKGILYFVVVELECI